jgi:hypothetical protein
MKARYYMRKTTENGFEQYEVHERFTAKLSARLCIVTVGGRKTAMRIVNALRVLEGIEAMSQDAP